jgi:hypothetical protein
MIVELDLRGFSIGSDSFDNARRKKSGVHEERSLIGARLAFGRTKRLDLRGRHCVIADPRRSPQCRRNRIISSTGERTDERQSVERRPGGLLLKDQNGPSCARRVMATRAHSKICTEARAPPKVTLRLTTLLSVADRRCRDEGHPVPTTLCEPDHTWERKSHASSTGKSPA